MLEATSHRIHVSENVVSQKTDILMGKMMIDDLYVGGPYLQTNQSLQVSAATLQAVLFRCHESRCPDVFGARLALQQKSCEAKVGELPRQRKPLGSWDPMGWRPENRCKSGLPSERKSEHIK